MSYIEDTNVRYQDTANLDASGRLRVSEKTTQIDIKQLHDNQPLLVDFETSNGTATHSTTNAETTLTTTAASGYAIAQTRQRFNYQSGKSQLIEMTVNGFSTTSDENIKVGYFTNSTTAPFIGALDGLFLASSGGDVAINVYKSGTAIEQTTQTSWNLDTMDGNGPSEVDLDWSTNKIFIIDFLWLGINRVRWGVKLGGDIVYFHESVFDEGFNGVYMSSPNQPLRWEARHGTSTAATLKYICASVSSEGSINQIGKVFSENLGTSHVNANNTNNKYALLGISLQSSKVDTFIDLLDISILSNTSDNQLVEVWYNPTVAGTFTFNAVTDSSCAIAKGSSGGSNTVTGGTLIFSQYVSSHTATQFSVDNAIKLGASIDGVSDTIVITCNPLTSNSDVLAGINWRELT